MDLDKIGNNQIAEMQNAGNLRSRGQVIFKELVDLDGRD